MSNFVRQIDRVETDWTKFFDYQQLVEEEITEYSSTEVTDRLLLGGIHANPAWDYWFQFLERQWQTNFSKEVVDFANQQAAPRILSLGCGHGGFELSIASQLNVPYELIAVDLNPYIFGEAKRRIEEKKLNIEFKAIDLNFVALEPDSFDVIFAHASLHHMLNLEHLMEQIYHGLKSNGRFVILDMIGEVQTLFWCENVEFARNLVEQFPAKIKKKLSANPIAPYQPPSLQVGMEGIRQEELEFEIDRFFDPIKCFKYNSFMRLIGTNPVLGNIFDLEDVNDREYLETLCRLDLDQVSNGSLRPTEMFAVYQKKLIPASVCATKARIKFLQTLVLQQSPKSEAFDLVTKANSDELIQNELTAIKSKIAKLSDLLAFHQEEIKALRRKNESLQEYISWMQGSKFWRLRQIWQLVKSIFTGKNPIDKPN
ncbi:MAG: hypothetical protein CV045_02565 [Cyanobacteria bacterium M5B4]|nr:MAG: hypothetical protein CV045_02565 [Cyanobacteria bacterium M5B4]